VAPICQGECRQPRPAAPSGKSSDANGVALIALRASEMGRIWHPTSRVGSCTNRDVPGDREREGEQDPGRGWGLVTTPSKEARMNNLHSNYT
jgi:hypothetical protein